MEANTDLGIELPNLTIDIADIRRKYHEAIEKG